jgi:hypothetical protein
MVTPSQYMQYLSAVRGPFQKLARIDFLQPDNSLAFSIDNNPLNKRGGAFIQEGDLSVNLQNGQRRQATITLSNLDSEYDYNVNKVWFGQQIRLMEGLALPDGTYFYLPQGVFYVKNPEETFLPNQRIAKYNLVDKWAYLDGTLFGNLEGWALIEINEDIFNAISQLLLRDRGNGQPIDNVPPIFTTYYNGKTITRTDGSVVPWTDTPYTARFDNRSNTIATMLLELNKMLVGWIGYDPTGHLRVDAAYEDILDANKPVQWQFSPEEVNFLGATYSVKNTEVYNDIIVNGTALSGNHVPSGRAVNQDPSSDTNIYGPLGMRTKVFEENYYYADTQCQELAEWYLKQNSVLKKSVTIQSSQLFHIRENELVTIRRTDKPGSPVERHLVTGYTRPIAQSGAMSIDCTSVNDFPVASPYPLPSTLTYATLAVNVDAGAVVTVTLDSQTLIAVSTGVAVFQLNNYGTWNISAETPTESGSTTAKIESPGLYSVDLTILPNT